MVKEWRPFKLKDLKLFTEDKISDYDLKYAYSHSATNKDNFKHAILYYNVIKKRNSFVFQINTPFILFCLFRDRFSISKPETNLFSE